jgi:hypothetical protein
LTTTILLGAAARGKTHRLVELLVQQRRSTRPRWAILPDRLQAAAFRRRVAQAGGALGVRVGTFGDLFHEILARAGRSVAITPEPARQHILRLALEQLVEAGELTLYQPIAGTAGLLQAFGEAFAELRRARVAPEVISSLGASQGSRLAELGRALEREEIRAALSRPSAVGELEVQRERAFVPPIPEGQKAAGRDLPAQPERSIFEAGGLEPPWGRPEGPGRSGPDGRDPAAGGPCRRTPAPPSASRSDRPARRTGRRRFGAIRPRWRRQVERDLQARAEKAHFAPCDGSPGHSRGRPVRASILI